MKHASILLLLVCLCFIVNLSIAQVPNTAQLSSHIYSSSFLLQSTPSNDFIIANTVCGQDTVLAFYTGNAGAGASYNWDFGGGVIASGAGAGPYQVYWPTPGSVQVCLTVTEAGLTSPINCQTVVVKPRPLVVVDPVADQCFTGNSFVFTNSGDTADVYLWDFGAAAVPAMFIGANPPPVTYQSPGIKTISLQVTADGCQADSSATAMFKVQEAPSASFSASPHDLCLGDSLSILYLGLTLDSTQSFFWEFGSQASPSTSDSIQPPKIAFDSAGAQVITLTVSYGLCVSNSSQSIQVIAPVETADSLSICPGDSILFGSQIITSAGVYTDTFSTVLGCDSTVTLTVTVNPPSDVSIETTICEGDSLFFDGQYLRMSGTYQDTLMDSNGCDSVVELTLHVNSSDFVDTSLFAGVCQGELPYLFGGQELSSSGSFFDTLTNVNGCDSVVQLNLTVIETETGISITDSSLKASLAADGYQWVDCIANFRAIEGATSQVYLPNQSGDYAVITFQETCIDTSQCALFTLVNVNQFPSSRWRVSPNPAQSHTTVDLDRVYSQVRLTLVNQLGQQLASSIHADASQLVCELPKEAGVYLLIVQTVTGETRRWRVVKE